MLTRIDEAIRSIKTLPSTADYEAMIYRLYVLEKIEKGRDDVRNGRVFTQEEAMKEAATW